MGKRKKEINHSQVKREPCKRIIANPACGLTSAQANERFEAGYANTSIGPPSKTVGQIIKSNVLTYFNMIFFILGILIVLVRSYRDLTFLVIITINIITGIVQELQAKKALDNLTFISAPKAEIIRDKREMIISTEEVVLDDIAVFSAGNQIYADALVVAGEIVVNESLVTGEADEITKNQGEQLLSGSFVISGKCRARLEKVGEDSYVSQLSLEAKKAGGSHKSEMMLSLDRIVKIIGIIIIPVGIALFIQQTQNLGYSIQEGVVSTVAALIGMIPEGLYLLTTAALAISVMRLSKNRVLVHEMRCIETLARVDVLCVDKTGTITENKMSVKTLVCLCEKKCNENSVSQIMSNYVNSMAAENETMTAIKEYFTCSPNRTAKKTLPFSSSRKYGGVSFSEEENYFLGAPEFILGTAYEKYKEQIEQYSQTGCRVLLLAKYGGNIVENIVIDEVKPLSLILLTNLIRKEAPETFAYFKEQDVQVKVISGDNAATVSAIALEAGIPDAENYVDATTFETPKKLAESANKYTVFGRVTPQQKRMLVGALRDNGHTVAMTGDGVNDVLALKDADCSIAMASGSDVAAQVSQLVLLDSNFSSMPSVVAEGRRVINNIERSASLFLVRNVFSLFLALITIAAALPYPIAPSQVSLVNGLCIGFPAFVLALEPNTNRIKGHFLSNVLYRAFPAGLTNVTLVLGTIAFYMLFGITKGEMSTISTLVIGVVGIIMVYRVSTPFNMLRKLLLGSIIVAFAFSVLFLGELFSLATLSMGGLLVLVVIMLDAFPTIWAYTQVLTICKDIRKSIAGFFRRMFKRESKQK